MARPTMAERAAKMAQNKPKRIEVPPLNDDDVEDVPSAISQKRTTGRSGASIKRKTTRVSLDLLPNDYKFLKEFSGALATEHGVSRVTHADVLRAAVGLMQSDPELRAQISNSVGDQLEK